MFLTLLRLKKTTPPLPKGLWQDPVLGYFETHGKMEFKAGEEYDITDDEKKAVMERYKIKELLKQRYIEQEFNPLRYKYVEGIVVSRRQSKFVTVTAKVCGGAFSVYKLCLRLPTTTYLC